MLLGAIAWLVVRQVVTPVRMAAGIAERLSAGRLQERMKVTGEDDIARLGEAFNKMAQNLQLKIQQLEELRGCSGGSCRTSRTSCVRR